MARQPKVGALQTLHLGHSFEKWRDVSLKMLDQGRSGHLVIAPPSAFSPPVVDSRGGPITMFKMFSTMILFGLLTISAAYAQSGQPIQAKVPFAFTVQDKTLAAGNYQLTYSNTAHALSIRALEENSVGAFATAIPAETSESSNGSGRLVFHCYGQTCYLAQVWQCAIGGGRGLKLRQTQHERTAVFDTRMVLITIPVK